MKFPSLSLLSISQIGALIAAGGGVVEGKKYFLNDLNFENDLSFKYIHTNKGGQIFDLGGCDYVDEKPTKRCKKKINGDVVAEKCQASCKKYLKKKLQPSLEGERLHVGCDAFVFKTHIQCDIFGENDPDLCMIQMVIVGKLSEEGTTISNGFKFDSYASYERDINDIDVETACMSSGVFTLDRVEGRDLKPIPLINAGSGAGCKSMGLATPPDYQFVVKGRMGRDGTTIDLSFSSDMGVSYYSDSYVSDAPYLYTASTFMDDETRRELSAGESLYFSAPACIATTTGSDDADVCQREVLTRLDFTQATLTENTLHLPDQSGRLVYSNIGELRGEVIDLVVRQAPGSKPYTTSVPGQNGYLPDDPLKKFGNVNVQTIDPADPDVSDEDKELMNGEVELEFCFHYAGTDQKAKVDTFSFVLFDLDQRGGGLQEKITIDTSQASRFYVEGETEVKMWCEGGDPSSAVSTGTFQYSDDGQEIQGYAPLECPGNTIFHATTPGTQADNPNDPTDLFQQQLARAVEFRFDKTDCWTLKFEHYCPCVDDDEDEDYCAQPGAPDLCNSNSWCPQPGNRKYNRNFPGRCKGYSGGNLVFAGGADERLADGTCTTPEPVDECDEEYEVSTDLDFSRGELIENTLHLPDQSGRLRYENIGVSRNQQIDLVVTQAPGSNPYTTDVPNKNGYNLELGGAGPKFGNINVMTKDPKDRRVSDEDKELMNGEVELEFCFYYTGTEEKARPDSFIFTMYDLDFRDGGVQERLTIDTSLAERFYVSEVTEVRMWCEGDDPASAVEAGAYQYIEGEGEPYGVDIQTYGAIQCPVGTKTIFHSTTVGTEGDNPQDPTTGLTEQQMARSIEFRFKNTQCWTIKLEHFCPCVDDDEEEDFCAQPGAPDCNRWCPKWKRGRCKWYSGANFVFAGKAEAQLTPVCGAPAN